MLKTCCPSQIMMQGLKVNKKTKTRDKLLQKLAYQFCNWVGFFVLLVELYRDVADIMYSQYRMRH